MKNFRHKKPIYFIISFITIFSLIFSVSGCSKSEKFPVSLTNFYFNTAVTITIYEYSGELEAKNIIKECFNLCRHYEQLFSKTVEDSDISLINKSKGKTSQVSRIVSDIIADSIEYSKISEGAFDISIGTLNNLWNITGENPSVPSKNDIKSALKHVNYKKIKCDTESVLLTDKKMQLDVGGIAKGFVADKLKEFMTSEGVSSAIIDLGGNILTIGQKSNDEDFVIGIKNPFYNNADINPKPSDNNIEYIKNNEQYCVKVNVNDKSIVTSGIYERYFVKDNKIYHHILDTSTGYPVDNNLVSVTIISDSSKDGDALSTTAFTLGLNKGMSLINSTDKTEAVFVTKTGAVYMSNGLQIGDDKTIQIETSSKQ